MKVKDSLFLSQIEDLRELAGKSVTMSKDSFERLISMAKASLRITSDSCNCTGDQYGWATNPSCVVHGNRPNTDKQK